MTSSADNLGDISAQLGTGGPRSGRPSKFRRMRMLPDEEYQRLKQRAARDYDPSLVALAQLGDEGRHALGSALEGGPSVRQHLRHYTQSLDQARRLRAGASQEYRLPELYSGLALPVPPAPPPTPAPTIAPAPAAAGVPILEGIAAPGVPPRLLMAVDGVPPKFRRMAQILAQFVAMRPEIINVGENNELVINGTPVPDSNFFDLFNFVYRAPSAAHPAPAHSNLFFTALKSLNPPLDSLGAHVRTQIGTGIANLALYSRSSTPPGIRRTIAHPASHNSMIRVYNDI